MLYYLFTFLLLIAFPLGEIIRIPLTSGAVITVLDLAVVFIAGAFLLSAKRDDFLRKLSKPLLVFLVFQIISLFVNFHLLTFPQVLVSFMYTVRWVLYSSIYFAFFKLSETRKNNVFKMLIVSGLLTAFVGYVQYFLYPEIRNLFYLGWDEHLYRLVSSILDPNFTAVILFSSAILIYPYFFTVKTSKKYLLILPLVFLVGALILTYSRGGMAAFIFASVIFLFLTKLRKIYLAIIPLVLLVLVGASLILKSEGTNLLRTSSIEARVLESQITVEFIKDNPVFGIGFNAYRYALRREGYLKEPKWEENHGASGASNSTLFVFATTGFLGLLSYFYLLYSEFRVIVSTKQTLFKRTGIALFAGIFVSSLFINSLFFPFILVFIWIILSFMESR